jgi:O-antigen ligase/tetratricopeptide (TPR) repeat protein
MKKTVKYKKSAESIEDKGFGEMIKSIPFTLIIFAYLFIVTYTPNFNALDTNTTKFFSLALVNIFGVSVLLANKSIRQDLGSIMSYFRTNIGLAYTGFFIISLISVVQAINPVESFLQLGKLFSVLLATFVLSAVISTDLRFVRIIAVAVCGMLIFDAIAVFIDINKFIHGEIKAITEIKTIYSNKNILASAIFVKLAFAIYLLAFEKGWLKGIAWVALTFGIMSTFFMATRAFYLGLLMIYLVFIVYQLVDYYQNKQIKSLKISGLSIAAIILALGIFSYVQKYQYPKESKGRHTQSVTQQLGTIKNFDNSTGLRIKGWRWSWAMIKENPMLGVGTGNWKVSSLKYENQVSATYIYLYKAHNDFMETAAETGIFGGLLFLSIFIFSAWNFLKYYRKKSDNPDHLLPVYFLAAAGMIFYSVDAFFNFPADRPEILVFFALFFAFGVSALRHEKAITQIAVKESSVNSSNTLMFWPSNSNGKIISTAITAGIFIMMIISARAMFMAYESSKLQRIFYQEVISKKLNSPASLFVDKFPPVPQISGWGESIRSMEARYLEKEGKNREVITRLMPESWSPYDARREFYLAIAYNNLKIYDSALYYSRQVYQLKPNYYNCLNLMLVMLEKVKPEDASKQNNYEEISQILDKFLATNKREADAWIYAADFYKRTGKSEKALQYMEEASQYVFDKRIAQNKDILNKIIHQEPYLPLFDKGVKFYQNKQYQEGLAVLNEFIRKVTDHEKAYEFRAFCNYHLKNFEQAKSDADAVVAINPENAGVITLRGVAKLRLGDKDGACEDFKKGSDMGNTTAKNNYTNICNK